MKLLNTKTFLLALATTAVLTVSASAEDRRVEVFNDTDSVIVEFYGSNVGTNNWEEDILGQETLEPGDSAVVNFDDATGHCRFDVKAVFEDGEVAIKKNINVCELEEFHFTE